MEKIVMICNYDIIKNNHREKFYDFYKELFKLDGRYELVGIISSYDVEEFKFKYLSEFLDEQIIKKN